MTAELQARMDDFQRAIEARDRSLAEQVLDDEYALTLVHPSPATVPRARWLDMLPDYVVHGYVVEDVTIDLDGDCAAVLQRVTMQATALGEERSGCFVLSDIWRLRDDGWRVWRRHSTPLTAGDMPGR